MNDEGVHKTAPARPFLSIIQRSRPSLLVFSKERFFPCQSESLLGAPPTKSCRNHPLLTKTVCFVVLYNSHHIASQHNLIFGHTKEILPLKNYDASNVRIPIIVV